MPLLLIVGFIGVAAWLALRGSAIPTQGLPPPPAPKPEPKSDPVKDAFAVTGGIVSIAAAGVGMAGTIAGIVGGGGAATAGATGAATGSAAAGATSSGAAATTVSAGGGAIEAGGGGISAGASGGASAAEAGAGISEGLAAGAVSVGYFAIIAAVAIVVYVTITQIAYRTQRWAAWTSGYVRNRYIRKFYEDQMDWLGNFMKTVNEKAGKDVLVQTRTFCRAWADIDDKYNDDVAKRRYGDFYNYVETLSGTSPDNKRLIILLARYLGIETVWAFNSAVDSFYKTRGFTDAQRLQQNISMPDANFWSGAVQGFLDDEFFNDPLLTDGVYVQVKQYSQLEQNAQNILGLNFSKVTAQCHFQGYAAALARCAVDGFGTALWPGDFKYCVDVANACGLNQWGACVTTGPSPFDAKRSTYWLLDPITSGQIAPILCRENEGQVVIR